MFYQSSLLCPFCRCHRPRSRSHSMTFMYHVSDILGKPSGPSEDLSTRLSSLLWRLRRATTIETGLFEIEGEHLSEAGRSHQVSPASREIVRALCQCWQPSIVSTHLDLRRIFAIIYANNAEISITSAENDGHDLRRKCGEWLRTTNPRSTADCHISNNVP